jgi:hypothetical protein
MKNTYNKNYSKKNCDINDFHIYNLLIKNIKNVKKINNNTRHSKWFLLQNWFYVMKIKFFFHTTLHIIIETTTKWTVAKFPWHKLYYVIIL